MAGNVVRLTGLQKWCYQTSLIAFTQKMKATRLRLSQQGWILTTQEVL